MSGADQIAENLQAPHAKLILSYHRATPFQLFHSIFRQSPIPDAIIKFFNSERLHQFHHHHVLPSELQKNQIEADVSRTLIDLVTLCREMVSDSGRLAPSVRLALEALINQNRMLDTFDDDEESIRIAPFEMPQQDESVFKCELIKALLCQTMMYLSDLLMFTHAPGVRMHIMLLWQMTERLLIAPDFKVMMLRDERFAEYLQSEFLGPLKDGFMGMTADREARLYQWLYEQSSMSKYVNAFYTEQVARHYSLIYYDYVASNEYEKVRQFLIIFKPFFNEWCERMPTGDASDLCRRLKTAIKTDRILSVRREHDVMSLASSEASFHTLGLTPPSSPGGSPLPSPKHSPRAALMAASTRMMSVPLLSAVHHRDNYVLPMPPLRHAVVHIPAKKAVKPKSCYQAMLAAGIGLLIGGALFAIAYFAPHPWRREVHRHAGLSGGASALIAAVFGLSIFLCMVKCHRRKPGEELAVPVGRPWQILRQQSRLAMLYWERISMRKGFYEGEVRMLKEIYRNHPVRQYMILPGSRSRSNSLDSAASVGSTASFNSIFGLAYDLTPSGRRGYQAPTLGSGLPS